MQPQAPEAATGSPKQQVADRLNKATSILVTVSSNPTVDQLAACVGFTLLLNKLGRHATAVFSGQIPSTVEFLQPEKTIKKNTDSLRDFIIALDKSKADKLRYKIEDTYVKIFITPYKTAISEKDLDFSQGDVNVDVILALGVHKREELDGAITAHGRILHDAAVISVNTGAGTDMGALNWREEKASSLCEMLTDLGETLKPGMLDSQIATALLTGIVAETARFSNAKTSAQTMSTSAKLINAGANQQLVATKLEPPTPPPPPAPPVPNKPKNDKPTPSTTPAVLPRPTSGSLSIPHDDEKVNGAPGTSDNMGLETRLEQIDIDDEGRLLKEAELARQKASQAAAEQPFSPVASVNSPALPQAKPIERTGVLPTQSPPPIPPLGALPNTPPKTASNDLDAVRRSVSNALDNTGVPASGMAYEDLVPKDLPDPEDQPSGSPTPRPSDPAPTPPPSPTAPPPVPPPLMPGSGTTL